MQNNKKNFYIFLDIDGVLYDIAWKMKEFFKGNTKVRSFSHFNPNSIESLNYLIQNLEQKYNVDLVISSTWRHNMQKTIGTLKNNGLIYNKEIHNTIITKNPNYRGEEILQYLSNKKDSQNYLIIDDESFDFNKYFSKNNIIKTNIFNNALNKDMIKNFLNNLFKKSEEIK